jgi:hypothetical protein
MPGIQVPAGYKKSMAKKRRKAPRGSHYMPNGKLMKNSAHKKKKKRGKKKG